MTDTERGMNILSRTELTEPDARTGFFECETELLPTGRRGSRIPLVTRRAAVAVLPVDLTLGRIALIRQGRIGANGMKVTEAPAGLIRPGEDPIVTADRETVEETGLRARRFMLVAGGLKVSPGYTDEDMWLYLTFDLEQGTPRKEDATIELIWQPLDQLDRLIDEAIDGGDLKTYALLVALWRYLRREMPERLGSAG